MSYTNQGMGLPFGAAARRMASALTLSGLGAPTSTTQTPDRSGLMVRSELPKFNVERRQLSHGTIVSVVPSDRPVVMTSVSSYILGELGMFSVAKGGAGVPFAVGTFIPKSLGQTLKPWIDNERGNSNGLLMEVRPRNAAGNAMVALAATRDVATAVALSASGWVVLLDPPEGWGPVITTSGGSPFQPTPSGGGGGSVTSGGAEPGGEDMVQLTPSLRVNKWLLGGSVLVGAAVIGSVLYKRKR